MSVKNTGHFLKIKEFTGQSKKIQEIQDALYALHIWNVQPLFTYSLYNFYGAMMTIKTRLLLSFFTAKHSVKKI